MLLVRLIIESISFAFNSLKANKLRTFLSLLGITIGIFAIISVFTVIDSLENSIKESLNSLGSNMVYIQQRPWGLEEGETEYPMWKYLKRPQPTYEETNEILHRGNNVLDAAFFFVFNRTVQSGNNVLDNVSIASSSYGLYNVWNLELSRGRYFSESEMKSGAPVTVIGFEISKMLFNNINPIGQTLKIQGQKFHVIGVYKKKGKDMYATSMDKLIHISTIKSYKLINVRNNNLGQTICVKAKSDTDKNQFFAELENIMRTIRRLKPLEEKNFALNEVSILTNQFDQIFRGINLAGSIIGGFSIIVGGFGIANIMFVSVKERTRLIGIQKSLGAKKYFILLQFIFEATVLSVIGGIVGLLLIYLGTQLVNYASDFSTTLTIVNIIRGLLISGVIGFAAGFLPARSAARLDPVAAMNAI